jgi:flavin reductase (DIM6/NTAB) family NADH-FMN oxidoreductase RutF
MTAVSAPTGAPSQASALDARELRQVLGAFVTGVTVITTVDGSGKCWGLTANSFTSVSLNPPLILWNQSTSAPSYPVFRDARHFAVNILAHDQIGMSRRFSGPADDKFAGVAVRTGLGGVPLIEGCAAYLECTGEGRFPGGDHAVFLGRVERMEKHPRAPLVFGQGRYLSAQPHEYAQPPPGGAGRARSQLHALRVATALLAGMAHELDRSMALSVWGSHGPTVVRWEQPAIDPLQAELPAGQVCRLLTSATGLAWAAFGPAGEAAALMEAEFNAPLEGAPASADEVAVLLAPMRRHGLARVVCSPHFTDRYGTLISAAAAPVFDAQGRMVLALTVVGASDTTDVSWDSGLCLRLKTAAQNISQSLQHRPDTAH